MDFEIIQLMKKLHIIANLGSICINNKLETISIYPINQNLETYKHLGFGCIFEIVEAEISSGCFDSHVFYTVYLTCNLACNLWLVKDDMNNVGAIVSQPFLINKCTQDMMDDLIKRIDPPFEIQKEIIYTLHSLPIFSGAKIFAIGEYVIEKIINDKNENIHQEIRGGFADVSLITSICMCSDIKSEEPNEINTMQSRVPELIYTEIKNSIQRGAVDEILHIIDTIHPGQVSLDHFDKLDCLQSLKYHFIRICSMSCYAAIDANAPYDKMMNANDEFIKSVNHIDNINDIFELMKSVMVIYTRAVAVNKISSLSKPVRLTLEYIENHFSEKITLEILSEHIGISKFYLSNLLKKETGRNLLENINRIRIGEGKRLLFNTNKEINEIATITGFKYGNHFASVFKKLTGMTPSEYKTSLKNEKEDTVEFHNLLFRQIDEVLSIFIDVFDAVRIVDSSKNAAWIVKESNDLICETCYEFWGRNEACENCISRQAHTHNRTFVKIENQGKSQYVILAAPKKIGKRAFVVEFIKRID